MLKWIKKFFKSSVKSSEQIKLGNTKEYAKIIIYNQQLSPPHQGNDIFYGVEVLIPFNKEFFFGDKTRILNKAFYPDWGLYLGSYLSRIAYVTEEKLEDTILQIKQDINNLIIHINEREKIKEKL